MEDQKKACIETLRDCQKSGDIEVCHWRADEALCEFLKSLGHGDIVAEWEAVEKWYA